MYREFKWIESSRVESKRRLASPPISAMFNLEIRNVVQRLFHGVDIEISSPFSFPSFLFFSFFGYSIDPRFEEVVISGSGCETSWKKFIRSSRYFFFLRNAERTSLKSLYWGKERRGISFFETWICTRFILYWGFIVVQVSEKWCRLFFLFSSSEIVTGDFGIFIKVSFRLKFLLRTFLLRNIVSSRRRII